MYTTKHCPICGWITSAVKCPNCGETINTKMKCTDCGKECYENDYPEVVFRDADNCICEECSIDYDEVNGKVVKRWES